VWVWAICGAAGAAGAAPPAAPAAERGRELAFTFSTAARFAEMDGFLQSSAGGEPGTSSPERPTFDEIGIREVVVMDFGGTLSWGPDNLIARARIMQPSGGTVLDEDLLSQGETFTAGTPVDTDTNFNQYMLAYGHDFEVARNIVVRPLAAVTILNIRYQFEPSHGGGPTVSAKHAHPAAQIGADVTWRPGNSRLSLLARGLWSVPIEGMAEVHEADFQFRYDVRRRASGEPVATVWLGVGFQRLAYDDGHKNELANELDADLGPLLTFGLDLRF
jgi:hypothetical protein